MTAQIAILNKNALAVATDTAETIRGDKVFNTAEKLFQISDAPVGIMSYGRGQISGVPFHILAKLYSKKVDETKFSNLSDYVNDFLNFLRGHPAFTFQMQEHYYFYDLKLYCHNLVGRIEAAMKSERAMRSKDSSIKEEYKSLSYREVILRITNDLIKSDLQKWENQKEAFLVKEEILKSYFDKNSDEIDKIMHEWVPEKTFGQGIDYTSLKKLLYL